MRGSSFVGLTNVEGLRREPSSDSETNFPRLSEGFFSFFIDIFETDFNKVRANDFDIPRGSCMFAYDQHASIRFL